MTQRIVYVSCADPREIHAFTLNPVSGALTPRAITQVPGLDAPSSSMPLTISPDRRVLHAGLRLPPFPVVSFRIDPADGALHLIGAAPIPLSHTALAVDMSGSWLLSASYPDAELAVARIGADGAAQSPAEIITATLPKAHNVLFSPDNRFVYVTCLGGDATLCWGFDEALGLVSPQAQSVTPSHAPGAGPRHMAFSPEARMLYVMNELDGTIDVFARDSATGGLNLRQTVAGLPDDAHGKAAGADIHLTPDGRFLYASLRSDSTIAAYRVSSADHSLALIGRFPVEDTPRDFAIDPDGRFLVCASRTMACVGVHAIDQSTGAITPLATLPTGENANWVEIIDLP